MKKIPHNNIDFIALVSHQLRTPLTIMKGYLSMILYNDFGKITEPDLKKALQIVYQSNENLINLVENLLSKARLDTINLQLTRRSVNIQKLISSIVIELQPKAKTKDLTVTIITSKNIFITNGDIVLLRQVFMNLINNAIDYTKKGEIKITLKQRVRSISVTITNPTRYSTLRKLKMVISKIKSPFIPSTVGFGFGLYIANLIIKAHQGILSVRYTTHKELEVRCELPILL